MPAIAATAAGAVAGAGSEGGQIGGRGLRVAGGIAVRSEICVRQRADLALVKLGPGRDRDQQQVARCAVATGIAGRAQADAHGSDLLGGDGHDRDGLRDGSH